MNRPIYYAIRTQRIDFSYAKMHATAARGLTRDPTVFWRPFSREASEYPHKPVPVPETRVPVADLCRYLFS